MAPSITKEKCSYCFLDFDIDRHRSRLATAAAFVDATDSRYGFSSKDLLFLGGSEVSRIPELIATDHEWGSRNLECGGVLTRAPVFGNRLIIRLHWDVAPIACENFATLCANGSLLPGQSGKCKPAPQGESGKLLSYRNSIIHRVIPGFIVQGGDFVFGNGSGGESIFGKKFKDERAGLQLKHCKRGILSMGNSGKNSNTSQFFITFEEAKQCDGKHVIFGEVVSGFEILDALEKVGTSDGTPSVSISITDCGIYEPLKTPSCGYWYDKPDCDSFSGLSSIFIVRPRVAILAPSEAAIQKFSKALGVFISLVSSIIAESSDLIIESEKIVNMLRRYAVDVVLIAPACREAKARLEIPQSWTSDGILLEEVAIVAKPVEALPQLQSNSWLGSRRKHWRLDGCL